MDFHGYILFKIVKNLVFVFFCPETETLEGYVTESRLGRGVKFTIRKIGTIREIIYGFGQIPLGGSQKRGGWQIFRHCGGDI